MKRFWGRKTYKCKGFFEGGGGVGGGGGHVFPSTVQLMNSDTSSENALD